MRYDLPLILELCRELELPGVLANERVEIALGQGAVLCFQNADQDEDCLVGFEGTPWHAHENFMFDDGHGNFIELNYLDIVTGIRKGHVLVCERWQKGTVKDRWLLHRDCNDFNHEFKYMENGEELRVWYPAVNHLVPADKRA